MCWCAFDVFVLLVVAMRAFVCVIDVYLWLVSYAVCVNCSFACMIKCALLCYV